MLIYIVLLSLITIRTTGAVIKASSKANLSQNSASEDDTATPINTSIVRVKPTRRPSHDDRNHLDETAFIPLTYFQIQYAPLPERFEKSADIKQSTKIVAINFASTETSPEEKLDKRDDIKTNIAPYFDGARQSYRSFVPGHNIEVFQSVNRNSGLNTMYKSYPEILQRNKNYKNTFMGEKLEIQTPEHLVTQIIPIPNPSSHPVTNKNIIIKPSLIHVGIKHPSEKADRQNALAKIRRLHLNLARVYSQGQGIPDLPMRDTAYSVKIRSSKKNLLPELYPEVFNKPSQLMGDQKTDFRFLK